MVKVPRTRKLGPFLVTDTGEIVGTAAPTGPPRTGSVSSPASSPAVQTQTPKPGLPLIPAKVESGDALVQAREKVLSGLEHAGLTKKQAMASISSAGGVEAAAASLGLLNQQVTTEEAQRFEEFLNKQTEGQGVFSQETPEISQQRGAGGIAGTLGLQATPPQGEITLEDFGQTKELIAQITDIARRGITGKKPTKAQAAEAIFTSLVTSIQKDVNDVKLGVQDPNTVSEKFRRAQNAISLYEGSYKGLGSVDLRFWLSDGKEVEADILIMKDTMVDLATDLEIAKQQWREINRPLLAQQFSANQGNQ